MHVRRVLAMWALVATASCIGGGDAHGAGTAVAVLRAGGRLPSEYHRPCRDSTHGCAHALRLRGGKSLDELQAKAKDWFLAITPLTRGCMVATVTLTLLFAVGLATPELLQADWDRTTRGLQLWRPFTGAIFVGQLHPQIIMRCYYWLTYGQELERALGSPGFARALVSLILILNYFAKWLSWPFVADALIMALTTITTRMRPSQRVALFGIPVPNKYLPFVMVVVNYVSQQKPPIQDCAGIAAGFLWAFLAKLHERSLVDDADASAEGAEGAGDDVVAEEASKPKKQPGRRKRGSILKDEER